MVDGGETRRDLLQLRAHRGTVPHEQLAEITASLAAIDHKIDIYDKEIASS